MYHVFIIRPSGGIEHTTQPKAPKLEQLQEAVGGYIETVPYFTHYTDTLSNVTYKRGRAYANEDGVMKGLSHNQIASILWKKQCKYATGLVGNVVFYAKEPKV